MRSTLGLPDLEEIFFTHFHADHYLGLPGMLKTFALRGREVPLTVYGPPGLNDLLGILRCQLAIAELEGIVANMEAGQLPLKDALAAYKRGAELLTYCQASLKDAQQQVEVLEQGVLKAFAAESLPDAS